MYNRAFNSVFWGLLIELVDFRIGVFDILPDFLGMIMVFNALNELAIHNIYFSRGKLFSVPLIFLSLNSLFEDPQSNLLVNPILSQGLSTLVVGQVYTILHLIVIYNVIRGISKMAEDQNLSELKRQAKSNWRYYVIVSLTMLYGTPFLINLDQGWTMFLTFFIILFLLTMAFILVTIRRAGRELTLPSDKV